MVTKLQTTSMVDKIYMSPSSPADKPIRERDLQINFDISEFEGVHGTTQGKPPLVVVVWGNDVSLVALDFAGLTTNVEDLKEFLSTLPNIKNIIIDHLPQ
ncbi:hypothetical protein BDC45DRAFT_591297 [Circinella umbellata]|nr:hypothetical protein BDC45DRAFT_591297 [Circinella umbellata]